ncbi:DUF4190 domain-containing protein, partial [Planctomycetota bacterium]
MATELQDRPVASEPEFEYRSVSMLSILGLVLGIASFLALLSPVGWIVPVAGAVVSTIATLRVHRNADRFTGKTIAMIGMCLSLWLGAWAPTKFFADRQFLSTSSERYTEKWLRYVANGDVEVAHQATLEFRYRQPKGTNLKQHYKTSEIDRADMNEYFSNSAIKHVVSRSQGTALRKQDLPLTVENEHQLKPHEIAEEIELRPPITSGSPCRTDLPRPRAFRRQTALPTVSRSLPSALLR